MRTEILPAYALPVATLAEVFTRAYEGYIAGAFALDTPGFVRFLSQHGGDLWLSRIVLTDEKPTAFAYVNRTGDCARIASLGVVPEARRHGLGRLLLQSLVEEARQRGESTMMLEVVEQNPPAIDLYRSVGFATIDQLLGWRLAVGAMPASALAEFRPEIRDLPLVEAAQAPTYMDYPTLPWQISRHAVAKAPPGSRAFATTRATVVVSSPDTDPIRLMAMFSPLEGAPGATSIRSLIAHLVARFEGRSWWAPALFPERLGRSVLHPLGFSIDPISQFLMRRPLT